MLIEIAAFLLLGYYFKSQLSVRDRDFSELRTDMRRLREETDSLNAAMGEMAQLLADAQILKRHSRSHTAFSSPATSPESSQVSTETAPAARPTAVTPPPGELSEEVQILIAPIRVRPPRPAVADAPAFPQAPSAARQVWIEIEKKFAGNLTGLLGVLAVVLGVIFLGVYAAVQLPPIGRCAVVCAFSAACYGLYLYLKQQAFWRNISLWLRSASGVIFLIACLGSISIDSMKWVTTPTAGLAVLAAGLGVNLVLGFMANAATFASVHVLVSFLALSQVPQVNTLIFAIAALIGSIGILMSYGQKVWDRHVAATLLGFTVFHFYFIFDQPGKFPIPPLEVIPLCLIVCLFALGVHYQKVYSGQMGRRDAVLTHLLSWAALAANISVHDSGSPLASIALFVFAAVAFGFSGRARAMNIDWLFTCDRLAALVLATIGSLTLSRSGVSHFHIAAIVLLISLAFNRVTLFNSNRYIFRGAVLISYLSFFALAALVFEMEFIRNNATYREWMALVALLAIGAILLPSIEKVAREKGLGFNLDPLDTAPMSSSFIGALPPGLAFLISIQSHVEKFPSLTFASSCASVIGLLVLREKVRDIVLEAATLLATVGAVVLLWLTLLSGDVTLSLVIFSAAAALLISATAVGLSRAGSGWSDFWQGFALLWGSLLISAYALSKPYSPLLTGVLWLLLALIVNPLRKLPVLRTAVGGRNAKVEIPMIAGGLVALVAFVVRFFLVDIQSEVLLGPIRLRLLSEGFALMTLLHWLLFGADRDDFKELGRISKAFGRALEGFLLLLVAFAVYELPDHLRPLLWTGLSIGCYLFGRESREFNRLIKYSYLFYLLGLGHIAFLSSTLATPSQFFLDQAWVIGLIGVFFSTVINVVLFLHFKSHPLAQKSSDGFMSGLNNILGRHTSKALIYPLSVAVAFFLFWSFDKATLSLLWVVECFILFLISLFLREPQFRIVSMAGIVIIFLRMSFYDLRGQDFFMKAVLFISVGLILIAMNIIYNKFKGRYNDEKK